MLNNYRALSVIIEASNTNPQGDPDQDNLPRINPINSLGLFTSGGFKRKVRDQLEISGNEIYIARNVCFSELRSELIRNNGLSESLHESEDEVSESEEEDSDNPFNQNKNTPKNEEEDSENTPKQKKTTPKKKSPKPTTKDISELYDAMTEKYIDVRLFGQLIPKFGKSIRGPIQVSTGVSLDPVDVIDMTITRVAVESKKEAKKQDNRNQTIGSKSIVSYGLYRFDIFVNPHDAYRSKCSEEDYEKFVNAILLMFQNDCSSSRILSLKAVHELTFMNDISQAAPMQYYLSQINITKKTENKPSKYSDYNSYHNPDPNSEYNKDDIFGEDLFNAIKNGKIIYRDRFKEFVTL